MSQKKTDTKSITSYGFLDEYPELDPPQAHTPLPAPPNAFADADTDALVDEWEKMLDEADAVTKPAPHPASNEAGFDLFDMSEVVVRELGRTEFVAAQPPPAVERHVTEIMHELPRVIVAPEVVSEPVQYTSETAVTFDGDRLTPVVPLNSDLLNETAPPPFEKKNKLLSVSPKLSLLLFLLCFTVFILSLIAYYKMRAWQNTPAPIQVPQSMNTALPQPEMMKLSATSCTRMSSNSLKQYFSQSNPNTYKPDFDGKPVDKTKPYIECGTDACFDNGDNTYNVSSAQICGITR